MKTLADAAFIIGVLAIVAALQYTIGFLLRRAYRSEAQLLGNTITRRRRRYPYPDPTARSASRK